MNPPPAILVVDQELAPPPPVAPVGPVPTIAEITQVHNFINFYKGRHGADIAGMAAWEVYLAFLMSKINNTAAIIQGILQPVFEQNTRILHMLGAMQE